MAVLKIQLPRSKTFLYACLKPLVRLGASFFFRKIEVRNAQNLPVDRPVILVANHQNAMMDPVVIGLAASKQLHWLTRADVFKKPIVKKLLTKLNMLPVYRERDRVSDLLERNKKTFEECYFRLRQNSVICIFPEGTHRGKKQLVPLKKGLARMVAGAWENGIHDLCVVPVGLDYENYYSYRKNLLINFGKPIEINQFFKDQNCSQVKLHNDITNSVGEALKAQMIQINTDEVYHEIVALKPLCDKLSESGTLSKQFDFFKSLSVKWDLNKELHAFLHHDVRTYVHAMHDLKIREELYREKLNFAKLLGALLLLPCALLSAFIFFPIYTITENFVAKVVRDPLFRNSVRICFWTFITPLWLILVFMVLRMGMGDSLSAFLLTVGVVFSGIVSMIWWRWWCEIKQYYQCFKYKKENRTQFLEWLGVRSSVVVWIKQLNKNQKHV